MNELKSFEATVFECSYEDNYEDGEVDRTYGIVQITSKVYHSVEEAIKEFIDMYHGSEFSKPEVVDDSIIAFDAMKREASEDRYANWADPSEADIQKWKDGKINLWNVEYQLHIKELVSIPCSELKVALSKI